MSFSEYLHMGRFLVSVGAVLLTAASGLAHGAKFRVISNMGGYSQPGGVTEGSPGVFYADSGAPPCVFSVTKRGALTNLACPAQSTQITSIPVTGNNYRIYSGVDEREPHRQRLFSQLKCE